MLPFAIIWCLIDTFLIKNVLSGEDPQFFLIPFFLFHMMPVWIYLFGVVTSFLRYRHTFYAVTDRAIYISGGALSVNVERKPLEKLFNMRITTGIIDRVAGVSSIYINDGVSSSDSGPSKGSIPSAILFVENADELFKKISQLQRNAFNDAMYPNEYRPN